MGGGRSELSSKSCNHVRMGFIGRLVIPGIAVSIVAAEPLSGVSDAGASGGGLPSLFNRSALGKSYLRCSGVRKDGSNSNSGLGIPHQVSFEM